MRYVVIYLGVGLLVLAGFGIDAFAQKTGTSDWSKMATRLRRERMSWTETFLERVVLPAIAGVLIVGGWPLALAFAIQFYRRKPENDQQPFPFQPQIFSVRREHLLERHSIEDIEKRELVIDPLNAVPSGSFGHLQKQWLEFREHIRPTDQLWSFEVDWGECDRATEKRAGYAILRGNDVPFHFLKQIRLIEPPLE